MEERRLRASMRPIPGEPVRKPVEALQAAGAEVLGLRRLAMGWPPHPAARCERFVARSLARLPPLCRQEATFQAAQAVERREE